MSRDIFFITHPDVVIDPSIPAPRWGLSERGRRRMRCLLTRDWTARIEVIYCSTEQKALDGAVILSEATGIPHYQLATLGENDRSATGYLPTTEFEASVDAFFAHPNESIRGWRGGAGEGPTQAEKDCCSPPPVGEDAVVRGDLVMLFLPPAMVRRRTGLLGDGS